MTAGGRPRRRDGPALEERAFHRWLARRLPSGSSGALPLGDDAAEVELERGEVAVVTTDALVEGTHFVARSPPAAVGRAASAVSLSDVAAKGARPVGVFLAVVAPRGTPQRWAEQLVLGAERALETGIAYIRERQAFGQPLGKFEAIQFELADLFTQVEAVKWQCRRAAWLIDRYTLAGDTSHRREVDLAVASVKLTAPQVAFECVKRVMMWHGAAGYTKEAGLELGLRGIMSYLVGAEGGLNIMRIILGRELLGKEFVPYK